MSNFELLLDIIEIKQRVGSYYIASIKTKYLLEISSVDRMRMEQEGDSRASYLGIQRKLDEARVKKIAEYVKNRDSAFPTSILLAITEDCAEIIQDETGLHLKLKDFSENDIKSKIDNQIINSSYKDNYLKGGIAKILDGQHRLAGLAYAINSLKNHQLTLFDDENNTELLDRLENFELNVSIFIGYDIHEQAKLFGIVNLAQTKVNKSLVYNLEEYSKARSPQRVCHNIAKLLDQSTQSPFYERIKMLGCKTEGRKYIEPLTQATFVETLISLLSKAPEKDRDILNRQRLFKKGDIEIYSSSEKEKYIFRDFFEKEKDGELLDIIWNYFSAIKNRWPNAWNDVSDSLLPKNNCFRALMRFLRERYNSLVTESNKGIPSVQEFESLFKTLEIKDEDFNSNSGIFPRGDGGMNKFYKYLSGQISYSELKNKY